MSELRPPAPVAITEPMLHIDELDRATIALELRRPDEAISLASEVLRADADNWAALCVMSQASLSLGHVEAAAQFAGAAVRSDPGQSWSYRLVSAALLRLGRFDDALSTARRARYLDPELWVTHLCVAQVLASTPGTVREAQWTAETACSLAPNEPAVHLVAAEIACVQRRLDDAEASLRVALRLDPLCAQAHHELARIPQQRKGFRRTLRRLGPAALADQVEGFAAAVRADPRSGASRRTVEDLLRQAAWWTRYLVWVDVLLIVETMSPTDSDAARLTPVLLLALPALYARRFLSRLSAGPRAVLKELRSGTHYRLSTALLWIAALAMLACAVAPERLRLSFALMAALFNLASVLLLIRSRHADPARSGTRRHRRRRAVHKS